MVDVALSPQSVAKETRMVFLTKCVAAVFPRVKDKQQPKRIIFDKAAKFAVQQAECPDAWNNIPSLRTYIKNKWKIIRLMMPEQEDIVPVYVNGAEFGGGGGYREGDLKHARKQLERDKKIADGVVNAANDYAEATLQVFPQIEATRQTLVNRRIEKKKK